MTIRDFFLPPKWTVRDSRGVNRRVRMNVAAAWAALPDQQRTLFLIYLFMAGGCLATGAWSASSAMYPSAPAGIPKHWPADALLLFLAACGVWNAWCILAGAAGGTPAAKARLARGVCPSCSYSIATLLPGEDGCLVCPECGGAWRPEAE
jgi:hypothetical protein